MTRLTPFEELDDAEVVKLFRNTMALLNEPSDEPAKRVAGSSAALFLINLAHTLNEAKLTLNMSDVTLGHNAIGNWSIVVTKDGFIEDEEEPQIVLGGTMKPDRVNDAMDCFDKLTVMRIRSV